MTNVQVGPGLLGTLTIVLLLLKEFSVINIGWIWVFAPLWIGAIIAIVVILMIIIAAIVAD